MIGKTNKQTRTERAKTEQTNPEKQIQSQEFTKGGSHTGGSVMLIVLLSKNVQIVRLLGRVPSMEGVRSEMLIVSRHTHNLHKIMSFMSYAFLKKF